MEHDFLHLALFPRNWLNPEFILEYGGITLLLIIIFLESGIIIGFLFPGDSLLFTTGLLISTGWLNANPVFLIPAIIVSGLLGAISGYYSGWYLLKMLPIKAREYIARKQYLEKTAQFYAKYDWLAFIAGRYVPVIRTFIPILAGAIKLNFKRFIVINVAGFILWVPPLIYAGFYLGKLFPGIFKEIEFIVVITIVVAYMPVLIIYFLRKRKNKKQTRPTS